MGVVAPMLPFLLTDLMFLRANFLKVQEGGSVPLAIAALVVTVTLTWLRGSAVLNQKDNNVDVPLATILRAPEKSRFRQFQARRSI